MTAPPLSGMRSRVPQRTSLYSYLCPRRLRVARPDPVQAVLAFPADPSLSPRNSSAAATHEAVITEPDTVDTAAVPAHAAPAAHAASALQSISLATSGCKLILQSSGSLSLYDDDGRLVAKARLQLPDPHEPMRLVWQRLQDGFVSEAVVQWGDPEAPVAELLVKPPAGTGPRWCQSLSQGFVLELHVSRHHAKTAELAVELDPSGHWFGGAHLIRQLWPLNHAAMEVGPWYPFDNGPNGLNNIAGPHWVTSKGLLVMLDPDLPFLHIGMNAPLAKKKVQRKWGVGIQNMGREHLPLSLASLAKGDCGDGLLRIQAREGYQDKTVHHPLLDWEPAEARFEPSAGRPGGGDMLSVRVALCASGNAKDAVLMALRTLIPPKKLPAQSVLKAPIWTTWARYKTDVSQAKVLKYAQEIVDRGLQRSVMEIDDRWQSSYGELDFDKKKFPDARAMVSQLHAMGFEVTCWVMPFVEERSQAYKEGAPRGYFVRSAEGGSWWSPKPGFFKWWNSPPVMALDVTNPEAVGWFVARLKRLQEATGIDGFKFDAGEPCFLPRKPITHKPLATPQEYTRLYVTQVAGQFSGGVSEVRTAHMTQDVPILTRMGDRFSTWDISNGLQSIIPTLLTSGLLGYPFCLPDMIGGNAYFGVRPDSELMVRWAQLNALMPAMQFSIAPWDLNRETEKMVASALGVRQKLTGVLLNLANEAAHALKPICRPLWFLDPYDEATYTIYDQYALGDDVIVAPVVQKGANTRDVYLTQGMWRELHDETVVFEGGQWVRNLSAPLDKLPCFVRVGTMLDAA